MNVRKLLIASAACAMLAACGSGGSDDKPTPAPFNQSDFTKNFRALMAEEPTHFQNIVGEKQGHEGIVGIFESKIQLSGVSDCVIKNTADDKAMALCTYKSDDTVADAKKTYESIKKWAIAAVPDDAKVLEQQGDDDVPMRYIIRYKGQQAVVGIGKNDDTKKYDVGFIFAKPTD